MGKKSRKAKSNYALQGFLKGKTREINSEKFSAG